MIRTRKRSRAMLAAGVVSLAVMATPAAQAQAKTVRVTGGTTTLTLPAPVTGFLSANSIAVQPISQATGSTPTFTLPIARGRVNPRNLRGYILYRGGLRYVKGSQSLSLRRITVHRYVSHHHTVTYLSAKTTVRPHCLAKSNHHPRRCYPQRTVRFARVVNLTWDGHTAMGTLLLTGKAAHLLRVALRTNIAAGAELGTADIHPAF